MKEMVIQLLAYVGTYIVLRVAITLKRTARGNERSTEEDQSQSRRNITTRCSLVAIQLH